MHLCPGNLVAIRRAIMYNAWAPIHLVQELNVGTAVYICDVSMLNVYGYGIHILETNGVLLKYEFISFINNSHLELDGVLYVDVMLFK